MTELTKEELLLAAERAAEYPPDFGTKWGYGPLAEEDPWDVLPRHADWLQYG